MARTADKSTLQMVNDAIDNADLTSASKASDELNEKFQALTDKLSKDVEKYVGEGIEKLQKVAGEYSDKLGVNATQAAEQAKKVYSDSEELVKKHPAATVAGAFAIGILLGALAKRSQ